MTQSTLERPRMDQEAGPFARQGEPPLVVDGLTKHFGPFVAVDKVSFTVPDGSIFGFLGPNGSGKTTTIGMVLGLMTHDGGTARIFGHDIERDLPAALAQVGALVERPALYPYLSGRQNIRIMARLNGVKDPDAVERVLQTVGLVDRADAKFGNYSQGMKQRLGIAAALIADPKFLILDEPTNGLDPAGQREIRALIRQLAGEGRTVMLSSHVLHEVQEVCTHVAIIDHGKLITTGPMDELLMFEQGLTIDVDRPDDARHIVKVARGVRDVRQKDGLLEIDIDPERAIEINRLLVESGIGVRELRRRKGQLEDRFLALTDHETNGA